MASRLRHLVATFILLPAALVPGSYAADLNFPILSPGEIIVPVGTTVRVTTTGNFTAAPTVRPLSNATLAAGGNHACVMAANGEVRCWGRGTSGQLGHGDNADHNTVVTVAG